MFCVHRESLSSDYVQVFCPPAGAIAEWTHLYVQGDVERFTWSAEVKLSSSHFGDILKHCLSSSFPIHLEAPARRGRPPKRSSEPREICGTGGEKNPKMKSCWRRSARLRPPPGPGSTLPSAGWSSTCLQGPVSLTSSSIRAAYIHTCVQERLRSRRARMRRQQPPTFRRREGGGKTSAAPAEGSLGRA